MIDYFTFSLVIDDIVLPDGRTCMGLLGGGGPQAAFGMKLWATGGVGICAGVGSDFPPSAQGWLEAMEIDTAGVRYHPHNPTLRAWQILEDGDQRTQVWRTRGSVIPAHLAFSPDLIPPTYWQARGFHFRDPSRASQSRHDAGAARTGHSSQRRTFPRGNAATERSGTDPSC